MTLTTLRLLGICSALVAHRFLRGDQFTIFLAVIGLGHYVLAFIYSRSIIWKMTSTPRTLGIFTGWVLIVLAMTHYRWPAIIIFFGIHHVLSEVYAPDGVYPSLAKLPRQQQLFRRLAQGIFYSLIYFQCVKNAFKHQFLQDSIWLWGLLISALWYAYLIVEAEAAPGTKRDLLIGEGLPFVIGVYSFFHPVGFPVVLFYHFTFWVFYPLVKLKPLGRAAVVSYTVLTVVVSLAVAATMFFASQKLGSAAPHMTAFMGFYYLNMIGFVHIGLSFALSRQNPALIRRLFGYGIS